MCHIFTADKRKKKVIQTTRDMAHNLYKTTFISETLLAIWPRTNAGDMFVKVIFTEKPLTLRQNGTKIYSVMRRWKFSTSNGILDIQNRSENEKKNAKRREKKNGLLAV